MPTEGNKETLRPRFGELDPEPRKRRSPLLWLGLFTFALLAGTTVLFWSESVQSFPHVPPGSYIGSFKVANGAEEEEETRFYLQSDDQQKELLVVVLKAGWQPQKIGFASFAGNASGDALQPLILKGPEGEFRLSGEKLADGKFGGRAEDLSKGAQAQWSLVQLQETAPDETSPEMVDTRLWLLLKAELADVDARIAQTEALLPTQEAEIDELGKYITEGRQLKNNADNKFQLAKEQLAKSRAALSAKRAEAEKLAKQFELSQKVTPMGKLVALSRESLEREGRWIESMRKTNPNMPSPTVDAGLERARMILDLRREIEQEHAKIDEISRRSAGEEDDSFYREQGLVNDD